MYKIKISSSFSAAHFLREYKGKCESLHGHNWKVEVEVSSRELNALGMVMDFSELKKITHDILETLDHKNLNDIEYFKKENPSSENIARYLFLQLKNHILTKDLYIREVTVWETDFSAASYRECDE